MSGMTGVLESATLPSLSADLTEAVRALPGVLQRVEAAHPGVSLASFGAVENELELLCASLAWHELNRALAVPLTQVSSGKSLEQMLQADPAQGRFLQFVLSCLEAEGWLEMQGDRLQWQATSEVKARCAQVSAATLAARYPAFSGLVELIEHCASYMVPVIQGRQDPLQVLFPAGNTDFLAQKSERVPDYSNLSQLRLALQGFIDGLADGRRGRPLRILEVGGGTGMLTRPLVERLKGRSVEYVFTDIGRSFLLDARKHARENGIGFMSFHRLDVSRNPAQQGFELGSYDLVLALDVVHATADVRQTAAHIRSLLVPGGALCLIELVKEHRWTHLVFGLLAGWWAFTDAPLRVRSPLLDRNTWGSVLREAGFTDVLLLPGGEPTGARAEKVLAVAVSQQPLGSNRWSEVS